MKWSHSPNKNSSRAASNAIRPITVYPKDAPNVIIINQMPTFAVLPINPLCSIEKKKYTIADSVAIVIMKYLNDNQKSKTPSVVCHNGTIPALICARRSASIAPIIRKPAVTPIKRAIGQRLIQPPDGIRFQSNITIRIVGMMYCIR